MNKEQTQGNAFILLSTVLFALNIPTIKFLVPQWLSPEGITFSRFAFATVAFWVASLFIYREKVPVRDLLVLFVGSLLGMVLNQLLFVIGLTQTSPIDASIILTLLPVVVMLIAAVVLKEPITLRKAGGVLLGACGALVIVLSSYHSDSGQVNHLGGNLLVLTCVVSYACYLVLIKPFTMRYHTITLMKWMFLFATITTFPYCYRHLGVAAGAGIDVYLLLFYVLFGATFFAFLLVPLALKRLRPTTVSMYNYAQPLIASLVAILLGQDRLTWEKPLSALLIFAGVYLVIKSKSRAQVVAEREEEAKEEGHA